MLQCLTMTFELPVLSCGLSNILTTSPAMSNAWRNWLEKRWRDWHSASPREGLVQVLGILLLLQALLLVFLYRTKIPATFSLDHDRIRTVHRIGSLDGC